MEDIFEKKQKIKKETHVLKKESLFDDSEKMELFGKIALKLAEKFFKEIDEITPKQNEIINGAANDIIKMMERFL